MDAPTPQSDIPDFATLAADPEIAPLLDFEPATRKIKRPDGWAPELQRELVARIAATGSMRQAVAQMGKGPAGAQNLYKLASADSLRAACDAAVVVGRRRNGLDAQPLYQGQFPGVTTRRSKRFAEPEGPAPGQVMNEYGEWEDEDSLARRAEDARDSISRKLLGARRLYLREISGSPGKRAAFEILTELPVDWERAERLEPQRDEPWHRTNMRQPDMLLTAENGWLGDVAHGRDKKTELRKAIDQHRAEEGLEPVDWDEDEEEEE